jgi:hypothetical protein
MKTPEELKEQAYQQMVKERHQREAQRRLEQLVNGQAKQYTVASPMGFKAMEVPTENEVRNRTQTRFDTVDALKVLLGWTCHTHVNTPVYVGIAATEPLPKELHVMVNTHAKPTETHVFLTPPHWWPAWLRRGYWRQPKWHDNAVEEAATDPGVNHGRRR